MGTCICMAESFDCLPETITMLLTGYTPIQNKKFIKKKKKENQESKQVVYRLFDFKDKEKNSIKNIDFESQL